MKNKTFTFPLDKIQMVLENKRISIIKVPQELYIEVIENSDYSGDSKSNIKH